MFPIRDENPTSSTAYVTIGLIVLNCLIFLLMAWGPIDENRFTWKYAYVPGELTDGQAAMAEHFREHPVVRQKHDQQGRPLFYRFTRPPQPVLELDNIAMQAAGAVPAWVNIFTCMFLHGGWMHLIGNMLYLWIFGNNIEDRLGPALFFVFYIATGLVGNLAHTFFDAGYVPLVGASGAISGVMGAYILLFPRTRILAVVPIGWYPMTVSLPAWVFLGIYFVLQNLYPASFGAGEGQVAYWAHIGGFVSGMALIFALPRRKAAVVTKPARAYDSADDADIVI